MHTSFLPILDLLLEPVPEVLADLRVVRFVSAPAVTCPRDEELAYRVSLTVPRKTSRDTYITVVVEHLRHCAGPKLRKCAVLGRIEHQVL